MSRTLTTSPYSSIHDVGAAEVGSDMAGPAPKPRFRPVVAEAGKHHPSQKLDLGLPQLAGATDGPVSKGLLPDLDPQSRPIIMLPPRPRSQFGTQRETQAMIRPEAHRELEDLSSDINPVPRRNWGGWLRGLFVSAWSFWQREREISRSIAALSEMDDRLLRDIGIHHRMQIPEIVRHGRQRA